MSKYKMPRMTRMGRRRAALRNKWGAKKRRAFRKKIGLKHGLIRVNRKVQELSTRGTGILGGLTTTSNNGLFLGTPVAAPGGSGLYDVPFSVLGRLDELSAYTEFTNLFDQYRIDSVKVQVQTWNASNAPATPLPYVQYLTDKDDAALPSISLMREKMGVKTKYFSANRPAITMGFRPRVASEVFSNGVSTGYGVGRPMFVNSTYPSVEHYGLKGVIRNLYIPAQAGVSQLTWDITYYLTLKDVQ